MRQFHRFPLALSALLLVAVAATAQETPTTDVYKNKDLGIEFEGVYGWDAHTAGGGGAWVTLAAYTQEDYDAEVKLQVSPNELDGMDALRESLTAEFAPGGEPAEGKTAWKEFSIADATMRKGTQLPGFDVEVVGVSIDEEGKKRERGYLVRTYFGNARLYRVWCSAKRARMKRVRDLFQRACANLVVTATEEKIERGVPFESKRGRYSCLVPLGWKTILPLEGRTSDARFEGGGMRVSTFSYVYSGQLLDHSADLYDFYGDDLKMDNEDARVLNGPGFECTVTKGDWVTLVSGTVRNGRAYRVHTTVNKAYVERAKKAHRDFLKNFKIER